MPAESADRRAAAAKGCAGMAPPPPEHEHLPCPRCDSTNTKFCYYNNYNFSQPRHFCKSCRRYWTQGGTLRDIPVGGGTRKNAKRSRILPPSPSSASATTTTTASSSHVDPILASHTGSFLAASGPLGLVPSVAGSFTSLLNASATTGAGGFLALGGLGLGIGPGFDDAGFGSLGRAIWAFPEVGYMGSNGGGIGNTAGGNAGGGMHTWQMESGGDQPGGGFVGDCFSWPELAISTPGNGLNKWTGKRLNRCWKFNLRNNNQKDLISVMRPNNNQHKNRSDHSSFPDKDPNIDEIYKNAPVPNGVENRLPPPAADAAALPVNREDGAVEDEAMLGNGANREDAVAVEAATVAKLKEGAEAAEEGADEEEVPKREKLLPDGNANAGAEDTCGAVDGVNATELENNPAA
ncbi:hypothetical protein V2J09_008867 [Rumex salicifolius]